MILRPRSMIEQRLTPAILGGLAQLVVTGFRVRHKSGPWVRPYVFGRPVFRYTPQFHCTPSSVVNGIAHHAADRGLHEAWS